MFGRHEEIGSRTPLTEAQIHGILSAISEIRQAEERLETKLREVGLNPWATNIAGHSNSKRGIVAVIEATLTYELPAAAQRREELKVSLSVPLSEIVEVSNSQQVTVEQ